MQAASKISGSLDSIEGMFLGTPKVLVMGWWWGSLWSRKQASRCNGRITKLVKGSKHLEARCSVEMEMQLVDWLQLGNLDKELIILDSVNGSNAQNIMPFFVGISY